MRILYQNEKVGEIKLLMQNLDDLWHLYNLVQPKDLVKAMTFRRVEQIPDKLRPERMEKKRMRLSIRVEKVEFHEFSDWLRIHGTIEEGPQDLGAHHTLNLTINDDIAIIKEWEDHHLRRIKEAIEATQKPMVSLLCLDDEEALLAELKQYGIKEVARIKSSTSGKMYAAKTGKEEFYAEIVGKLKQMEPSEALIIMGPGFAKEELYNFGREKEPELFNRCQIFGTSYAGMTGIQEAMKSGIGAKIFEESRVAQETKLVERLLEEIKKEGLYAYGSQEVSSALDLGAVETLLVSDPHLRKEGTEDLLRRAEKARSKIVIVSTYHEAGKKLQSLGGIASLLRFKIR